MTESLPTWEHCKACDAWYWRDAIDMTFSWRRDWKAVLQGILMGVFMPWTVYDWYWQRRRHRLGHRGWRRILRWEARQETRTVNVPIVGPVIE